MKRDICKIHESTRREIAISKIAYIQLKEENFKFCCSIALRLGDA